MQRVYYGSEPGKGEADGETGVFSQALARAVASGASIRSAADAFKYAQEHLTVKSGLRQRHFILVKRGAVDTNRPQTNVKTVPGTRTFHQVIFYLLTFIVFFACFHFIMILSLSMI